MAAIRQAISRQQGTNSVLGQFDEMVSNQRLASVDKLQAKILTAVQLDALAHVQDAIESIAKLQVGINQLCTLHSLNLRRIGLFELGMLTKEIEDLVFASQLTESRLRAGGIPATASGVQASSEVLKVA